MNGNIGITTVGDFGASEDKSNTDIIKIPEIYFLNNGAGGYYTTIGSYAFFSAAVGEASSVNRSLLTRVYLPQSITTIGESAFAGCDYLKEV